jgi:NAD+ kinase
MSWVGSKPRIACVASSSPPARAAQADLAARYDLVDPGDCDVIVALGGDGLLLHTIHDHLQLGRPIFGMNRGTVGFLMNQYRPDGLLERVAAATPITIHPLRMAATHPDGHSSHALAFNEVAVTPVSPFRPRRWKGALVPHTAEVSVENLDADKRPLAATADFHELFHVVSATIREDTSTAVQLLFDADHSLEERIIAEQFLS